MSGRELLSKTASFIEKHFFTVVFCGAGALALACANTGHHTAALTCALISGSALLMKPAILEYNTWFGAVGGLAAGAAVSVACGLGGLPMGVLCTAGTALGAVLSTDILFEDRSAKGLYFAITNPIRLKYEDWQRNR